MSIFFLGTIGVASCFIVWEFFSAHKIIQATKNLTQAQHSLKSMAQDIQRLREEVFILQAVLVENNLVSQQDKISARARLIENPKKLIQQHQAIGAQVEEKPVYTIVGTRRGNMH